MAGICCAIVAGFLISGFGGSRFQIGGPTRAFVVVVAGVIADHGLDGLFMATMMAGVILVVLGATGLGSAVKFADLPVATIGSRFGGIPAELPHFAMPRFRPDLIFTLLSPALTIAMLGAVESLMSAVVADRMGGGRHNPNVELVHLLKLLRADIAVWLTTFLLTVFADLTVAVEAGMILTMLTFIRRVTLTTTVGAVSSREVEDGRLHVLHEYQLPDYVAVLRIAGPLLFGSADKVHPILDRVAELPPIVILKLRHMTALDATGLRALEEVAARLTHSGRHLIVCGAPPQPGALLAASGFERRVGPGNVCANTSQALERAAALDIGSRSVA